MKKWVLSILSKDGDQSSKRLVGLYCIITGSALAWIATFSEYKTPEYMYNTIMFIGGGVFVGTMLEGVFTQKMNIPFKPKEETNDTPANEETVQ
jgi:hypothetical protein